MVTFKILNLLVCVDETRESCTTTRTCEQWPPVPPPYPPAPAPTPNDGLHTLMAQMTQAIEPRDANNEWLAGLLEGAAADLRRKAK